MRDIIQARVDEQQELIEQLETCLHGRRGARRRGRRARAVVSDRP